MKHVLISGTTSGIGKALEVEFSNKGWKVTGFSRRTGTDLSNFTELNCLLNSFEQKVDVLVHNAAVYFNGKFEEQVWSWMEYQFKVNLLGPIHLTRLCLKQNKFVKPASIVFVSTLDLYRTPKPGRQTIYNTTKAALIEFAQSLAQEYPAEALRVNAIALPLVKTPLYDEALPIYEEPQDPHKVAKQIFLLSQKGETGKIFKI